MWKRADVDEKQRYRIALCQLANGLRTFELVEFDQSNHPSTMALLTEEVPIGLLLRRNFKEITKQVKLTNGEKFGVDAHGTWLTKAECDAWDRDWSDVPWLNGIPPLLAPK